MKFLKEVGISDELIEALEDNYLDMEIVSMNENSDNIISSINYLKSINVNDKVIEDILILDYCILMPGGKALEKAVSKLNKEDFVNKLSDDINYMEYLYDIY